MSTLQRSVLLLEVSATEASAASGRVCTTEECAVPGGVYTTEASAASGRVCTTEGAMLTSPCLSWPTTLIPDGSSRPCPSGPKGTIPPHTSGPNFQVVLIQVTPKVHVDPLHVPPLNLL